MTELEEKRKQVEIMQFEFNILKLETRLLEIDEEKEKLRENIKSQQQKVEALKNG